MVIESYTAYVFTFLVQITSTAWWPLKEGPAGLRTKDFVIFASSALRIKDFVIFASRAWRIEDFVIFASSGLEN